MTTSLSPRKLREIIVQMLYSFDMGDPSRDDICALLMSELKMTRKIIDHAYEKAAQVYGARAGLDKKIADAATGYEFERIGLVERNILRLAVFESLEEKQLEKAIIISEANRLSSKFCADSCFVQALLNSIQERHASLSS